MNTYSIFGLILDIIGVIILFEYGLPSKYSDGEGSTFQETTKEEIERNKKNIIVQIMSRAGLCFVMAGFVFQILGCIPYISNPNPKSISPPKCYHYSYHCYCQESCICGCKDR